MKGEKIGDADSGPAGPAPKGGKQQSKKSNDASSIGFPYHDLETGVAVARAMHDAGGVPLSRDQLAGAMKLAAGSGNFVLRIGTARQFGLIESKDNKYQLTQLGSSIVDRDENRAKAARATAFLAVPLYRVVYDNFRGKPLPGRPKGLEAAFVHFGVAPKQKDKARHAFDRSARQAGFYQHGEDRLVEPVLLPPTGADKVSSTRTAEAARSTFAPISAGPQLDPLIQGLLTRLPEAGESWPTEARARWLQTLAANLDIVYQGEDGRVIAIEIKSSK